MQKSARISLQTHNQLYKKLHKKKIYEAKEKWAAWHRQKEVNGRKAQQYVKEERLNRREDWINGPLAPNRNAGNNKGVYGTIDVELIQSPTVPKVVRGSPKVPGYYAMDWEGKDKHKKFTGDTIVGNVVENDRVVIVHGPERIRGLVGHVISVDGDREEIKVQNVNVADVRVPPNAPQPPGVDKALYNTMEMPIPIAWVRLIANFTQSDGTARDVVVQHIHAGAPYAKRAPGINTPAHSRYVTGSSHLTLDGSDILMPWPEGVQDITYNHHEPDTERADVDKPTWQPGIIDAPLGYSFYVGSNANNAAEATAPYMLGLVTNKEEANNAQRAGLGGFINEDKLVERRNRIARGIMDELRNKKAKASPYHDDTQWVKRKILEDARSIWWRDRKVLSPAAEAAERAAHEKKKLREEQIRAENAVEVEAAVQEIEGSQQIVAQPKLRLPTETEALIKSMQATALAMQFKPDRKTRKNYLRS